MKKFILLFLFLGSQKINSTIPGIDSLTEREQTKLKSGFIISYLAHNIDTIKSYDKNTNTYSISNNAYIFIAAMSLIATFQRESDSNEVGNEQKKDWNYLNSKDIRKIIKNALCIGTGALFGTILPPLIQIPHYAKKCYNIIS